MDINTLLQYAISHRASDLHLSSGLEPLVRIDGDLERISGQKVLRHDDILTLLRGALSEKLFKDLEERFELDCSVELPGRARFRVNVFHQFHGISAAFRIIPIDIPNLADLGLPSLLNRLCELDNGLVLITGPTGSGKTTTLAAMIDYINVTQPQHILTLEDPIEFLHTSKKSLIQQREIHVHTESFQDGLRYALREDPDVILVGEMRDLETIRLALTAAETGHLVFATLHTNSAAKTIDRIIDVFPTGERTLVQSTLSDSLQAVISQTLLKKKNDVGRVAAYEIMTCTPAIRNMIRENKVAQIYSAIQTSRAQGMITLQQNLEELRAQGLIA